MITEHDLYQMTNRPFEVRTYGEHNQKPDHLYFQKADRDRLIDEVRSLQKEKREMQDEIDELIDEKKVVPIKRLNDALKTNAELRGLVDEERETVKYLEERLKQ